jgi:hypothetical protein
MESRARTELDGGWGQPACRQCQLRALHLASQDGRAVAVAVAAGQCATGHWFSPRPTVKSFFGTLKKRSCAPRKISHPARRRTSIEEYIEVFYNWRLLHSTLGYRTPEHVENTLPRDEQNNDDGRMRML